MYSDKQVVQNHIFEYPYTSFEISIKYHKIGVFVFKFAKLKVIK